MARSTRGKVGRPKGGTMTEEHRAALSRAMKRRWRERKAAGKGFGRMKEIPAEVIELVESILPAETVAPVEAIGPRTLSAILVDLANSFKELDALRNELADYLG